MTSERMLSLQHIVPNNPSYSLTSNMLSTDFYIFCTNLLTVSNIPSLTILHIILAHRSLWNKLDTSFNHILLIASSYISSSSVLTWSTKRTQLITVYLQAGVVQSARTGCSLMLNIVVANNSPYIILFFSYGYSTFDWFIFLEFFVLSKISYWATFIQFLNLSLMKPELATNFCVVLDLVKRGARI